MAAISFEKFFKDSERGKFLSRLFGIFSEEIVRIWCGDTRSRYEDLGRPTLKKNGEKRGRTLDFTFKSRKDGSIYVGELKCELEYQNYRYLTLKEPSQLEHHKGKANEDTGFKRFLDMARDPKQYTVNGKNYTVSGAVLVWGSVTDEGGEAVMKEYGLADVLSLQEIVDDLVKWNNRKYYELVEERAKWCQELFEFLKGNT